MPIAVECDCGKKYKVADGAAGKKIRCKNCDAVLTARARPVKKPADEPLELDEVEDEDDYGPPVTAVPPRQDASRRRAATGERAAGSGASTLKTVGGGFALAFGVLIILGIVIRLVNEGPNRVGAGAATAGAMIAVGLKWLRE